MPVRSSSRLQLKLQNPVVKEVVEDVQKKPRAPSQLKPFLKYKGKLDYYTEQIDVARICDALLDQANKTKDDDLFVVGFDMEWPFSFAGPPGRTAVIQIQPTPDLCYIFQVSRIKTLPKTLSEFLIHPKVRLAGNNVKNDVRKLARDYTAFDGDKMVENCIDVGVYANSIPLPVKQRWSLEKLVNYVLELRIQKDKKIRRSQWHVIPLSKAQQVYAAEDAYASLLVYLKLKEKAALKAAENEAKENDPKNEDPKSKNTKTKKGKGKKAETESTPTEVDEEEQKEEEKEEEKEEDEYMDE